MLVQELTGRAKHNYAKERRMAAAKDILGSDKLKN
jgi:hypothetical protein